MNLQKYLDKGVTFEEYKKDIQNVIDKGEGGELASFYPLNLQRMERLEKNIEINEDALSELKDINKKLYLLIITEGWCGDASQVIPVIEKIVKSSENITERIVYRDENQELINQYLTNGGQSIPIIVGVDEEGEPLFHWGPRPKFGMDLLKDYKAGKFTKDEFHVEVQKAYNKDKGQTIISEIINKIKNA